MRKQPAVPPAALIAALEKCGGDRRKASEYLKVSIKVVRNGVDRLQREGKYVPASPHGAKGKHAKPDLGAYLPSKEQIAAEMEAIRSQWSPAERRRRSHGFDNGDELGYELPVVSRIEITCAASYLIER